MEFTGAGKVGPIRLRHRPTRLGGQARNRARFKLTAAVYNLIRITAFDAAPA